MIFTSLHESGAASLDGAFMQRPVSLIDYTIGLFGFIPEDTDPRWDFLQRYADVKEKAPFSAMNFANAWGATYLSAVASYRSGYVNTQNTENCLQLERALDNLEVRGSIKESFDESKAPEDPHDVKLVVTDRLTTDPKAPKQIETPCPEALYQLRLYDEGYLARVGFNMHVEADTTVASIVNIQGTPGSSERNAAFTRAYGTSPFNMLVRRVVQIADVEGAEVRGLINPVKGNSQLYWGVFEEEQVDMYHAQRKPSA